MRSGEYGTAFLRIHSGTAGNCCHPAEPLVGGDEQINLPKLAQIERDGELQCIEGAKPFR